MALRIPQPAAEQAKRDFGHALPSTVEEDETVEVDAFGSEGHKEVPRRLIAEVLQARTEEMRCAHRRRVLAAGYRRAC